MLEIKELLESLIKTNLKTMTDFETNGLRESTTYHYIQGKVYAYENIKSFIDGVYGYDEKN